MADHEDASVVEPIVDLLASPILGIDGSLALDNVSEFAIDSAAWVAALVLEFSVGDPVGWASTVFDTDVVFGVFGKILGDPLLGAWRAADTSSTTDVHEGTVVAGLAFADTFSACLANWHVCDSWNVEIGALILRQLQLRVGSRSTSSTALLRGLATATIC